jgi:hypothetical protein
VSPSRASSPTGHDVRVGQLLPIALAGWIGVALVHVVLRSMVNSGRPWGPLDAWPRMIEHEVGLHAQWAPFVRRPFMNHLLAGLGSVTAWSAWTRFVVVQLAALGWAAIEMMLTARAAATWRGDDKPVHAQRALVMFFVYPAVLFAWFRPVYTFDDLLIVALVLRAVRRVIDQRWLPAAGLLALAAVGHEVVLFLLPAVAWLAWDISGRDRRVAVLVIAPALVWLVVRWALYGLGSDGTESVTTILTTNFGTPSDAISSLGAVILALGLPGVFIAAGAPAPPRLARYYVTGLAATLPILVVAAYLREFRLVALPGTLVLPFLVFRFSALRLDDRWQVLAAIAAGAAVIAVYHPVIASAPWLFRIYAGAVAGLFASIGLAGWRASAAGRRDQRATVAADPDPRSGHDSSAA